MWEDICREKIFVSSHENSYREKNHMPALTAARLLPVRATWMCIVENTRAKDEPLVYRTSRYSRSILQPMNRLLLNAMWTKSSISDADAMDSVHSYESEIVVESTGINTGRLADDSFGEKSFACSQCDDKFTTRKRLACAAWFPCQRETNRERAMHRGSLKQPSTQRASKT